MRNGPRSRIYPSIAGGALGVVLLLVAACGSDDGDGGVAADGPAGTGDGPVTTQGAPDNNSGGGTATLTIGDETWEFDTVQCAIGSDQTQSDEYDFSLSAIQDGLQLSVSRGAPDGQYGDSIDLDDIEDFENPSVSWGAPAVVLDPTEPRPDDSFVEVDGKQVTAESTFSDGTADDPTQGTMPGQLTATCP